MVPEAAPEGNRAAAEDDEGVRRTNTHETLNFPFRQVMLTTAQGLLDEPGEIQEQQQRISDAQRDIMKVLTLISWTLIAALIMIAGLASVLLQVQKEDSVKTQIEKRCIQAGGS